VIIPSIPLTLPNGDNASLPYNSGQIKGDPYLDIPKGVMPAIDKVVELGIADPERLAVMGHSYGGYSTFSLVTYTTRFKAAVAMAGLSDLVSVYGQFEPGDQFAAHPQDRTWLARLAEHGQLRLWATPQQDLWRYLKNSPLFFAERVQTPLMIVQGDLDTVPITQGEEFFTALQRQNKRVRFVSYAGEGHVIVQPANVRHLWSHIFAWFDEFCDISRDDVGNLIWDGDHAKSRDGHSALKPEDFARFDAMAVRSEEKADSRLQVLSK